MPAKSQYGGSMAMENKQRDLPVIGLYIHIPFCISKCPYCDFYSMASDEDTKDAYMKAVLRTLEEKKGTFLVDTVYFGGGTPSLMGLQRIDTILSFIRENFYAHDHVECTLEANPAEDLSEVFRAFWQAGGNRISMGLQAANDELLKALGRRHTVYQAERAVDQARSLGFQRISLDLMLGIEGETINHIKQGVDFCKKVNTDHVSAYLLKIEPNTPFAKRDLQLPSEDESAEQYLYVCQQLEQAGYHQYEISNFAKPGQESRHNLKYWNCEDVVGIGPAAHSLWKGKRSFYPRDIQGFIQGALREAEENDPIIVTGSMEEYGMLRLRLTEGISKELFEKRFGRSIPSEWIDNAQKLPPNLCITNENGIHLTPEGFLVSNAIISAIL